MNNLVEVEMILEMCTFSSFFEVVVLWLRV